MADARLAGGAVIISANADKLVAGLNKAEGKVKEFGKKTTDVWSKIGEKFGGGGGGFIAKALGAGFFGGIAGSLAIRGMNAIAEAIGDAISGTAKWQDRLERTALAWAEVSKQIDRALARRDEWTAIADKGEKEARLREDVETSEAAAERLTKAIALIRAHLIDLNSTTWEGVSERLTFGLDEKRATFKQLLDQYQAALEKLRDRSAKAGDELGKLLDPATDPAAQKALADRLKAAADFAKALRLEGKEAGMAAHELEALKKARELGAEGTMLGAEIREAAFAKRFAEQTVAAREFTDSLKVQRVEMGLTANEAQLLQHRLGGMSREMLRAAATELSLIEQLKEARGPEFGAAILADTADAHSLEIKHQWKGMSQEGNKTGDVVKAVKEGNRKLDKVEKAIKDNKLKVIP